MEGELVIGIRTIPLIIVGVYLIIMLAFGFIVNKFLIKTSTDYMLAGRRLGLIMVATTLSANNIGGGSTMGVATRAFGDWGMSAAWWVLAASVAMIPLAYFAPRIRKTMAYTIPEVIFRRFGPTAGVFTSVLNITSLFTLTASQILASGTVINVLVGIPLNVSIVLATVAILIYTCLGGLTADAYSDMFQYIIIFLGLIVAVPFVINGVGGGATMAESWANVSAMLPPVQLSLTKIGWFTIISLIINYFCTFLSGPEMVSRFSAAESEKSAQKASILSAIMMACMAFLPTLIGLAALASGQLDNGGQALMWATTNYAPEIVTGLVAAAMISATMSSADSNLLCASTIFIKDLYQQFINKGEISEKKLIFLTRASNVVLGIFAMLIALRRIDIISLNLFAFALRSAGPFAAYGFGLMWAKATKNAGLCAIAIGSVVAVSWEIAGHPLGVMPVIIGGASSALTFWLVTMIESARGVPPAPSPNRPEVEAELAEVTESE